MHRIDTASATPSNQFTDGDPGAGVPATVVSDDFLNAVQEEICGVVETAGILLAKPNNAQLAAAIRALIAAALPAGAVQAFARTAAPAGWLKCNGAAVSRVAYASLFAAVGTTFGVGDGASTFNLPELRGEFLRGWDDGRGVDGGRTLGSQQADDLKAHTHGLRVYARMVDGQNEEGDDSVAASAGPTPGFIESTGGAETRPRNVAMLWCIKT